MEKRLTPAECFEAVKENILSIAESRIIRCTLSNAIAIQEGNRVAELVRRYDAGLRESGIDPVYPDTISLRAGAYAHCVASEEAYVRKSASRKETFAKLKKEGYALRREMRFIMRYLFRDTPGALDIIDSIRSGCNDMEMIMNLLSLFKAYEKFGDLKSIPEHDMAAIMRLRTLHEELTDMAALIRIDPQIITDAAKTCAKAWTYLWEAMREIYSAGRHVFRNQARTKRLFYSRPFQEIRSTHNNSTNSKAKKEAETAPKAAD